MLEEMIDAEISPLGDDERSAIVAALAHLDSAATWVTFRREFGMGRSDIADAAAWAAEAVLDPIRSRVRLRRRASRARRSASTRVRPSRGHNARRSHAGREAPLGLRAPGFHAASRLVSGGR